jgi:hypothetical protein
MSVLRSLIAQASDPNSIVLAETTVDAYLAVFHTPASKTGAIAILQQTMTDDWRGSSGARLDFINLIFDYLDRKMRDLREPS